MGAQMNEASFWLVGFLSLIVIFFVFGYHYRRFVPKPSAMDFKKIVEFVANAKGISLNPGYPLPPVQVENLNDFLPHSDAKLYGSRNDLYGLYKWGRIFLHVTSKIDILVHEAVHYVQDRYGSAPAIEIERENEAWAITELFMATYYPWRYAMVKNICGCWGFIGFWGYTEIK